MPIGAGAALEVTRSLEDVDAVLTETRNRLILVALAGVLLASGLGTLVARAALAPVERLTKVIEEVAKTRDLSRRVATTGHDELSRLAASFTRCWARSRCRCASSASSWRTRHTSCARRSRACARTSRCSPAASRPTRRSGTWS
ncbi:MAG TPA: HAMP domain-containing protein [Candidatus Limnocylindria bacterium]|nr:HAMP domain-containing protein [Candidatus Limnocylindria bacterium]